MKQGYLLSYVNNTWWEIIKKYKAKIVIKDNFSEKTADVSMWYEDDKNKIKAEDLEEIKNLNEDLDSNNKKYKINNFTIRYSPKRDIPASIKGIAIQRGGMTVERLKTESFFKEESASKIYGWIEMNDELSEEMKNNCESPEHFNFCWTKKPATYLNTYIRSKIRIFARKLKLIETENAKKDKLQKKAAANAVKRLTPLFKKLNLSGKGVGPRIKDTKFRNSNEKLRLSAANFELPNENTRVNYGQNISGAYVMPINEYNRDFNVLVRVWIKSDEEEEFIIEEKEFILRKGDKQKIGIENLNINKKYNKGGYSFRAIMTSLEETDFVTQIGKEKVRIEKGTKLYERINKKFYIEADPPETGLFDFQPYESESKHRLVNSEMEDKTLILYYNTNHPKIKLLLSTNNEKDLEEYLVEQGIMLLYQIKIENLFIDELTEEEKKRIDPELLNIIKSKDINKIFPYLSERHSEMIWDYLE